MIIQHICLLSCCRRLLLVASELHAERQRIYLNLMELNIGDDLCQMETCLVGCVERWILFDRSSNF